MDKLGFWITVVFVSIIGIWLTKALVGKTGPDGLKEFMSHV